MSLDPFVQEYERRNFAQAGPTYRRLLSARRRVRDLEPWLRDSLNEALIASGGTTWMGKRTAIQFRGIGRPGQRTPFGVPVAAGEPYRVYVITLGEEDWAIEATQDDCQAMACETMGLPCQVPGGIIFFVEAWQQRFWYGQRRGLDGEPIFEESDCPSCRRVVGDGYHSVGPCCRWGIP